MFLWFCIFWRLCLFCLSRRPWHVFVDTSPDTDADFEVAATFDTEPTQEDVNYAIVECLEGSEREDELVAQQMQAALEAGQLNRVSDMLGITPALTESLDDDDKKSSTSSDDNKNFRSDEWDDLFYDDWNNEDSVWWVMLLRNYMDIVSLV